MRPFIANDVTTEIYIGKNAGQRINNELKKAKENVRIISPFLSSNLIDNLIELKNNNVNVKLISTDNNFHENYDARTLRKIIKQERILLEDEKKTRGRFYRSFWILLGIFILLTAAIYAGLIKYLPLGRYFGHVYLTIGALSFVLYGKYRNYRIYKYKYYSIFDGFFVVSPRNMSDYQKRNYPKNTFMHGKVYIIDDRIAFIGSLNFTNAGFFENLESCVTIRDPDTIANMIIFFENILQKEEELLKVDIAAYGRKLYPEPIN